MKSRPSPALTFGDLVQKVGRQILWIRDFAAKIADSAEKSYRRGLVLG